MSHQMGKTTPDLVTYSASFRDRIQQRNDRKKERETIAANAGETRTVSYAPSTIKPRLREVSDAIREHRTPELIAVSKVLGVKPSYWLAAA